MTRQPSVRISIWISSSVIPWAQAADRGLAGHVNKWNDSYGRSIAAHEETVFDS